METLKMRRESKLRGKTIRDLRSLLQDNDNNFKQAQEINLNFNQGLKPNKI